MGRGSTWRGSARVSAIGGEGTAAGERVRDAVGTYRDGSSLRIAVDERRIAGSDSPAIGVRGARRPVERKLGVTYARMPGLADEPEAPVAVDGGCAWRTQAKAVICGGLAYLGAVAAAGNVFASGGTLGAAVEAAVVAGGVGALIGGAVSMGLDRRPGGSAGRRIARGGKSRFV